MEHAKILFLTYPKYEYNKKILYEYVDYSSAKLNSNAKKVYYKLSYSRSIILINYIFIILISNKFL